MVRQSSSAWLSVVECLPAKEVALSAARTSKPIVVRRCGRSRLYDAENQRYVSVEQLVGWAAEGVALVVLHAETGADVTRVLLA
jgi:polyhydroxyalkanoate synthesis regulator protein